MRRWAYAMGGLLAWTVHFLGIYLFASVAAQTEAPDTGLWQVASLALTAASGLACVGLLVVAIRRRRRDPVASLLDQLAALGAVVGLIGIAFQTASALIV